MKNMVALICGLIFGVGLAISGMTQPQKVMGFLDLFGTWDPSLLFVMMGAIGVHMIAFQLIKRRKSPLLAGSFTIPESRKIDSKLLIGATLFGIGWGIGGYCPGPAIASLLTLEPAVWGFVVAMAAGMIAHQKFEKE